MIIEGDMAYSIVAPVTLNIDANGKIGGNGGCNVYGGNYLLKSPKKPIKKPRKIKFTDIISTMMACEGSSNTEGAFFRSLREAVSVSLEGNELVIKSAATAVHGISIQNSMTFARDDTSGS